jgi:hypothetical protein
MWIEPTSFTPRSGDIVGARLRIGQNLVGDPLPRDPSIVKEFVVEDATGRRPMIGRDGADPAGLLRVNAPGLLVIGYRSHPYPVALASDKFDSYLKEEGLDAIAALRARRGRTDDTREMFSRCAKSLVLSGPSSPGDTDRTPGLPLELVAERNPYGLSPGKNLTVRLTYEGRPLANALVVAMNRSNPGGKLAMRTDRAGRATFRLPEGGMWLIKAVHMIPAREGLQADWESFWASLTFELPAKSED